MADPTTIAAVAVQGAIALNNLCEATVNKNLGQVTKSLITKVYKGPKKVVKSIGRGMKHAASRAIHPSSSKVNQNLIDNVAILRLIDLFQDQQRLLIGLNTNKGSSQPRGLTTAAQSSAATYSPSKNSGPTTYSPSKESKPTTYSPQPTTYSPSKESKPTTYSPPPTTYSPSKESKPTTYSPPPSTYSPSKESKPTTYSPGPTTGRTPYSPFKETWRTTYSAGPTKLPSSDTNSSSDSSDADPSSALGSDWKNTDTSVERKSADDGLRLFYEIESRLNAQMKPLDSKIMEVSDKLRVLAQKPARAAIERTLRELEYLDGHLHIAVAGNTGTGKSSFINAIRGLRDTDADAAKVDYLESTKKITRYAPSSNLCKIVWYDVPGAGTLRVSSSGYFMAQGLYIMNAIIILWTDRLTDADVTLMEHCALLKIPCLLVRSKCDQQLRNFRQDIKADLTTYEGSSYIIATKFMEELYRFRRETVAVCRKRVEAAYAAAKSEWKPNWEPSIFLMNKYSLYAMIAEEWLDKNSLDEERFLQHLSFAMANFTDIQSESEISGCCSREELVFDRTSRTCSAL